MELKTKESSEDSDKQGHRTWVGMLLVMMLSLIISSCSQGKGSQQSDAEVETSTNIEVHLDSSGMEMVLIPSGEVTLIDKDYIYRTETELTYDVPGFLMDIHEVTNEQYASCVDSGACQAPEHNSLFSDSQYADHPLINVTQTMAASFCEWRDARLPTTLEWEKAAQDEIRQVEYFWGDRSPVCQSGSYLPLAPEAYTDLDSITNPVMTGDPNMFGLYDMTGSMWEWVVDGETNNTDITSAEMHAIGYLRMFRHGGYGPQYESYFCSFRCVKDQ